LPRFTHGLLPRLIHGSRASLLPPAPPSSLSALHKEPASGFAGNLRRQDWFAENASIRLATAWRCRIARNQLANLKLERKTQAATRLQGACRIMMAVLAAQSIRDELWREHVLEIQSLQLQKALLRLLGKPFALLRISDLLRNTSAAMKKSKYYISIMAKAISFCLEQNQHDMVKLLMDEGATLDIESINLTNVNIWLSSREKPQHILDNNNVDDNAHETTERQAQESETAYANQQMLENRESVQRVNAWLKGIVPDNTVDELTQLKRESVRLRLIIENQEVKIKELQIKCRRLERVERELERKTAILDGMLCCKCEKTCLPVQYSKLPIGKVCGICQAVVRKVNDEIEVTKENGKFLAKYGHEQDFYNGFSLSLLSRSRSRSLSLFFLSLPIPLPLPCSLFVYGLSRFHGPPGQLWARATELSGFRSTPIPRRRPRCRPRRTPTAWWSRRSTARVWRPSRSPSSCRPTTRATRSPSRRARSMRTCAPRWTPSWAARRAVRLLFMLRR